MNDHFIEQLVGIVGKKHVLHTPEDLAVYSYDGTFAEGLPEVVALPATTEEVSQVVRLAADARGPIVARSMGSGLAAGSIPTNSGGMVISLTRMNHILEIDTENAIVRTEAGVIRADLQAAVEKIGLFSRTGAKQPRPRNRCCAANLRARGPLHGPAAASEGDSRLARRRGASARPACQVPQALLHSG